MEPQYITLPKQAKELTGQRFGRLVALGPVGQSSSTQVIWHCCCDCGTTVNVVGQSLRSGITVSCGCWQRQRAAGVKTTHGLSKTKLYRTWKGMITRCTNPNVEGYENYGGRGIRVFSEWLGSFDVFAKHVTLLENCGQPGYSLDRINNDGDYEPGNVRWSTRKEQNRNSRHNRNYTYKGKTQSIAAWAEQFGIGFATLYGRLQRGWEIERALHTPIKAGGRHE